MNASVVYLFGVLRRFQHCTGHITTGIWKGRGNQYIQLVKVLYCKLLTNGKQPPTFPLEVEPWTEPRPQRWEARVLPLCHRGPWMHLLRISRWSLGYWNCTVSASSSLKWRIMKIRLEVNWLMASKKTSVHIFYLAWCSNSLSTCRGALPPGTVFGLDEMQI